MWLLPLVSFSFWAQSASTDFDWNGPCAHVVAQIGSLLRSSIWDIAVRKFDGFLNRTQAVFTFIQSPSNKPDRHSAGERSEEHTSELQSPCNLVCRLLLEKKKKN